MTVTASRRMQAVLHRRPGLRLTGLLAPAVVWLSFFYLVPLGVLLATAFFDTDSFTGRITYELSTDNVVDVLSTPAYLFTALRTVGVAVGVTLVLWLATVPGALQSRADRETWRNASYSSETSFEAAKANAAVLVAKTTDNAGVERIERFDVAALKPNVPVAAGIPKVPGPGEVLLSPALAKLAASLPADGTERGFGKCHASRCSCFRFTGSGFTCTRGGCGHHYDLHY